MVLSCHASLSLEEMSKTYWTVVVQSRLHASDCSYNVGASRRVKSSSIEFWGHWYNFCSTCGRHAANRICMCSVIHFFDIAILIELFWVFFSFYLYLITYIIMRSPLAASFYIAVKHSKLLSLWRTIVKMLCLSRYRSSAIVPFL